MLRAAFVTVVAGLVLQTASAVVVAASPDDPAIKSAIARGVASLKNVSSLQGGYDSLAGYAMLKGGVSHDDPTIDSIRKRVEARFSTGAYKPSSNHIYEAGCDLMFLEALDAEKYKNYLGAIVAFMASQQLPNGAWAYAGGSPQGGDQSITQYAALGLWAAARAEVPVPKRLWDAIAGWQVGYQQTDGGFGYHPKPGGNASTLTMTSAGVANLHLTLRYLYGEEATRKVEKKPEEKKEPPKFGVLKKIDAKELAEAAEDPAKKKEPTDDNYRPRTTKPSMERALGASNTWLRVRFPPNDQALGSHPFYFWYGLERTASLADVETINNVDWYDAGAAYLLKKQNANGSFGGSEKTCFAILFLTNATRKILGKEPRKKNEVDVGSGLLAGGRGIPTDLSKVVAVRDGSAEVRKSSEPLDDLLSALAKPNGGATGSAQQALVERIRLGNREELLEQVPTILELVDHPNWEIRRTAIWVLGRTENLAYADRLVEALSDDNLDVVVEARNALCFLSRRPLGLGAPHDPFAGTPDGGSEKQRLAAATAWKKRVQTGWKKWLDAKSPYDRRDRLTEADRRAAKID